MCNVTISYVNDVCYSVDQHQLISASIDGTIRVWDIATTNCLRVVEPARVAQSYADLSVGVVRGSDVDRADFAHGAESRILPGHPEIT